MKKLLIITMLCGTAHAEFMDGNELLSYMNSSSTTNRSYALGYVAGVSDALRGVTLCYPENVTNGQINDMIKNYLTNIPAERHIAADRLVNKALVAVWPCRRSGT